MRGLLLHLAAERLDQRRSDPVGSLHLAQQADHLIPLLGRQRHCELGLRVDRAHAGCTSTSGGPPPAWSGGVPVRPRSRSSLLIALYRWISPARTPEIIACGGSVIATPTCGGA